MKRLKKRLRDNRGESMTELIVAFSVFMLAMVALSSMVSVGLRLNRMAADADREYYADFERVEATSTSGMTVEVKDDAGLFDPIVLPEPTYISYYQNEAGLIYFEFDAATTPEPSGGGTTP